MPSGAGWCLASREHVPASALAASQPLHETDDRRARRHRPANNAASVNTPTCRQLRHSMVAAAQHATPARNIFKVRRSSPLSRGPHRLRRPWSYAPLRHRPATTVTRPRHSTIGGYADPDYVPPGERSKKSTRHRVVGAPRGHTSHRFERYNAYPAFAFGYHARTALL